VTVSVLRTHVRDAIHALIATGELKAGDRLGEEQLSSRLGVSRSPIREALRELEQQGVAVSYPNRGSFVVSLDQTDIDEILVVRASMEGLAARLASDRLARRDFDALERIVDRMEAAARHTPLDTPAIVQADAELHAAIMQASGNRRLIRMWGSLDPIVWMIRLRPLEDRPERHRQVPGEHRELLAALRAGPDEAEAAARFHVVRGLGQVPTRPLENTQTAAAAHGDTRAHTALQLP
jgi:DNA-binding GntR family transcriptional regulator